MHCVAAAAMPCVPDSHSDSPLPPRATLPFGVMDEDKHIFLCARFRSARNIFSAAARHHLIFERKTLEELLQSIITDLNKYTDIQWDIQRERGMGRGRTPSPRKWKIENMVHDEQAAAGAWR